MKYLFILGRNPELSIAELRGIFGKFSFERSHNGNAILAELPEDVIEKNFIERLGGTIAIGRVLSEGEDLDSQLNAKMLYQGTKNSISYVIWDFSSDEVYGRVKKYLKKRFREEKLRATEKQISGKMELQSGGTALYVPNRKLIDEQFFVFKDCFGRIVETCDYEEIERRDMGKPVRRESLAISPRLAKIMINLAQAKPGETLLDPFCGVGVILQEALVQGIHAIGIDKDISAINSARKNLRHFGMKDFELICGDSSKAKPGQVSAIVTEPDLGMVLKRASPEGKARATLKRYEGLMTSVLNNLKKNVSGRIVFTGPYIMLPNKKRIGCDISNISSRTGLKPVQGFPVQEFRKNQIVGREIFVLEKS